MHLPLNPGLIRLPSLCPIPLCFIFDLLLGGLAIDSPSDNDHIASTLKDDLVWCSVLLAHLVALNVQSDTGSQDQEILLGGSCGIGRRIGFVYSAHGDESEYEAF